jgi:hypothetical protein
VLAHSGGFFMGIKDPAKRKIYDAIYREKNREKHKKYLKE